MTSRLLLSFCPRSLLFRPDSLPRAATGRAVPISRSGQLTWQGVDKVAVIDWPRHEAASEGRAKVRQAFVARRGLKQLRSRAVLRRAWQTLSLAQPRHGPRATAFHAVLLIGAGLDHRAAEHCGALLHCKEEFDICTGWSWARLRTRPRERPSLRAQDSPAIQCISCFATTLARFELFRCRWACVFDWFSARAAKDRLLALRSWSRCARACQAAPPQPRLHD